MIRTIFDKVMWLGRAAVFLMGSAVILALTVGLTSAAVAGTGVGATLDLGQANSVNAVTRLVGKVPAASLQIDNNSSGTGATALSLRVEPGTAPMKVDSGTKVTNLNSDRVDGKDSSRFVQVGTPVALAAGQIRSEGSIRNSVGAVSAATHSETGFYCIAFSEPVDDPGRLESAVVGLAGAEFEGREFPRVVNGTGISNPCDSGELIIQVTDAEGNPTDTRFSFIVP